MLSDKVQRETLLLSKQTKIAGTIQYVWINIGIIEHACSVRHALSWTLSDHQFVKGQSQESFAEWMNEQITVSYLYISWGVLAQLGNALVGFTNSPCWHLSPRYICMRKKTHFSSLSNCCLIFRISTISSEKGFAERMGFSSLYLT